MIPTIPQQIDMIGWIDVAKCAMPDTMVAVVNISPVSIVECFIRLSPLAAV